MYTDNDIHDEQDLYDNSEEKICFIQSKKRNIETWKEDTLVDI